MLVATAGHIDHGKTSLIRALTGVETDRLPEEKARGISIDIGFAYWRPDEAPTIGFVDVPGHERFVRNMLAGVGAVDFALLVVAADDGVKPQTVEHVQILDLLGVSRGLVAITKTDRAPAERIAEVRAEVQALLARTSLADVPMFDVSSVTGAGVGELGGALRAANCAEPPSAPAKRNFRLAVDRAFSVTGVGTVVTGTVRDGALDNGARLSLSPRRVEVRVRDLQSGGDRVPSVRAGERCALNLAGVEVARIRRGDWLIEPEMHAPTTRIEARVRVLASKGEPLKHNTPVHLHLGAADLSARVLIARGGSIAPGDDGVVQLVLDHRTCTVNGDRFVLRDQSGRQTIGGGRVIDPFAPSDRRRLAVRAPVTEALERYEPAAALAALLAIPGHEVETQPFERCFNLRPDAAAAIYARCGAVLLGKGRTLILPAARVSAVGEDIVATLKRFHETQPEAEGMGVRELRAGLSEKLSPDAFAAIQRDLIEKRLIETAGAFVKIAGHTASYSPAESALWQSALPWLEERGAAPFTAAELARDLRTSESMINALLYRRRSNGDVFRITETRFMLRAPVAALVATAAELAEKAGETGFMAAQFRDATGIGRNLVIQLLEFFDSIGVTQRRGDVRFLRPGHEAIVGYAKPYRAAPAQAEGPAPKKFALQSPGARLRAR